ncbi:MAG TPA: SRPBCC family protein [Ohtaekwangia sp.]|nr:SRPBCC family protein [Ohtaekwangia sp.]
METLLNIESSEARNTSALPPATGTSNLNVGLPERIASVMGGAVLTVAGLRNVNKKNGIVLLLTGGFLLARGLSGYCALNNYLGRNTAQKKVSALEATGTFTINKPRAEVYSYWRKLENLPMFMKHLDQVIQTGANRSHWTARVPGGLHLSWDAEIIEDRPDEFISWSSLPGSQIDHAGEITFRDAPSLQATEIHASISYRLPAGDVGSVAGKLFNPLVENMIKEDLRRFKQVMEAGEIPTIEGQPSGRAKDMKKQSPEKDHDHESTLLERH